MNGNLFCFSFLLFSFTLYSHLWYSKKKELEEEDFVIVTRNEKATTLEGIDFIALEQILQMIDDASLDSLRCCSKTMFEKVEIFRSRKLLFESLNDEDSFVILPLSPCLLSLPLEVLAVILSCLEIPSLCSLTATCHKLHDFIINDDFIIAREAFKQIRIRSFKAALSRPIEEDYTRYNQTINQIAMVPLNIVENVIYHWQTPVKWSIPIMAVSLIGFIAAMPLTMTARMIAPTIARNSRRKADKQLEISKCSNNKNNHTNVWQRDSDAPKCFNCKTLFGITRRRHHCRCCRKVFCYYCLKNQIQLPKLLGYQVK